MRSDSGKIKSLSNVSNNSFLNVSSDGKKNSSFADESITTTGLSSISSRSYHRFTTVKFLNIKFREYNLTIGDNPFCTSGCPISIGWQVVREVSIPIDEYEENRPPRRGQSQLRIPKDIRQEILMNEWEIPYSQIREATADISKLREQRNKNNNKYHRRKKRHWKRILLCKGGNIEHDVLSLSTYQGMSSHSPEQLEIPFMTPKVSLAKLRKNSSGEKERNELDISNRANLRLDEKKSLLEEEKCCHGLLDISNQTIQFNNKSSYKTPTVPATANDDLDVSCRGIKLLNVESENIHGNSEMNAHDVLKTRLPQPDTSEDVVTNQNYDDIVGDQLDDNLDISSHRRRIPKFDDIPSDSLDVSSRRVNLIFSENKHKTPKLSKKEEPEETDCLDKSSRRVRLSGSLDGTPNTTASLDSSSRRVHLSTLESKSYQPGNHDPDSLDASSRRVRLPASIDIVPNSGLDTSSRRVHLPTINRKTKIGIGQNDNNLSDDPDSLDSSSRRVRLSGSLDDTPNTSLDTSPRRVHLSTLESKSYQPGNHDPDSLDASSRRVRLPASIDSVPNSGLDTSSRRVHLPTIDSNTKIGIGQKDNNLSDDPDSLDSSSRRVRLSGSLDGTPNTSLDTSPRAVNLSTLESKSYQPGNHDPDSLDASSRRVRLPASIDSVPNSSLDTSSRRVHLPTIDSVKKVSIGQNDNDLSDEPDSLDSSSRRVRLSGSLDGTPNTSLDTSSRAVNLSTLENDSYQPVNHDPDSLDVSSRRVRLPASIDSVPISGLDTSSRRVTLSSNSSKEVNKDESGNLSRGFDDIPNDNLDFSSRLVHLPTFDLMTVDTCHKQEVDETVTSEPESSDISGGVDNSSNSTLDSVKTPSFDRKKVDDPVNNEAESLDISSRRAGLSDYLDDTTKIL